MITFVILRENYTVKGPGCSNQGALKITAVTSHILHIGDEVFFGTKDEYLASIKGDAAIAAPRP